MSGPAATIINVSNRLPVTVAPDGEVRPSSGGLVAALRGVSTERFQLRWVGWGGSETAPQDQDRLRQLLEREQGLYPVFLTAAQAEGHYEGLSNSSLWPLLHYMPSKFRYESAWWDAYVEVNRLFADAALAQVRRGDELIWVHDYQLMLLPRLLRAARPGLRIGFFLHTPFPSYEVLRCHPHREELVDGLLGADLLGFHTFSYLRHFRSTAVRLLDVDADVTQIRNSNGRTTQLGVYPIGIDASRFIGELQRPELQQTLSRLRQAHAGKRVVLSVERVDYSKGLLQRLDAIELFLRDSGMAEQMRFIFVAIPSREGVEEYRKLVEELELRVGQINGRYGTIANTPLQFVHGTVDFTELCALYAMAEVALVTPVRDGMNLVAKEYVACQLTSPHMQPGALVLSEFAGAAEVLYDALLVNPFDVRGVAEALRTALDMPAVERTARMGSMRDRVLRFDAAWWANSFADELASFPAPAVVEEVGSTDPAEAGNRLARAIATGQRVALFLDYDGTLREIVRDPAQARPTGELEELLDALASLANVQTTIVSGRTPQDLDRFLGRFTQFAVVAEHGASLRRAGEREWEHLDRNVSYRWKEQVARVLGYYEATTPGSFVEDKRTSLVWHFRRADPEFGGWKARQLLAELESVTANQPLHVRMGRKIVEVTPSTITKGAAVARLMEDTESDLVLIAGDDVTDESMYGLELPKAITLNVGSRPTQALYGLPDPAALRGLLRHAISQGARLMTNAGVGWEAASTT